MVLDSNYAVAVHKFIFGMFSILFRPFVLPYEYTYQGGTFAANTLLWLDEQDGTSRYLYTKYLQFDSSGTYTSHGNFRWKVPGGTASYWAGPSYLGQSNGKTNSTFWVYKDAAKTERVAAVVYASTSNTITVKIIENGQFSDAHTLTTSIAEWRTSSTLKQITGVSMDTEGYFMVYWSEDASGPGMATKAKIFQYTGSNWKGHAPPAQATNASFVPTGLHVGLSWTTVLRQLKASWLSGKIWVQFYNNSRVDLSYYFINYSGGLIYHFYLSPGKKKY
jgi:hypothetical protein